MLLYPCDLPKKQHDTDKEAKLNKDSITEDPKEGPKKDPITEYPKGHPITEENDPTTDDPKEDPITENPIEDSITLTEAATRSSHQRCSIKKLFLKVSQYLQ